jgi:hypothetical protein
MSTNNQLKAQLLLCLSNNTVDIESHCFRASTNSQRSTTAALSLRKHSHRTRLLLLLHKQADTHTAAAPPQSTCQLLLLLLLLLPLLLLLQPGILHILHHKALHTPGHSASGARPPVNERRPARAAKTQTHSNHR